MKTLEPQDRQKQSDEGKTIQNREWRYGVWFVLLTSALFLIGCPDGNKENGKAVVRPPAQQEPIARGVIVLLLDGNTERRIAGRAQVTVRNKQGNLAGNIEDLAGNRTNTFDVTGGLLAFSVAEQARLPVQLIVVAQAQGFVSSSLPVKVTHDGHQALTLRMVGIATPPAGVTVARDTRGQADHNGMVTQAVVVETAPDPITRGAASVMVTPGTTVRSASGTALTGSLTTTVVYQNNQNVESLDTFPGGFTVTLAKNENGQSEENVVFLSGGFVAVYITDTQGNRAATFSQPIDMTAQIPGKTINPDTRQPVANGDQIPIWSYDINTGSWTFEQQGTAVGPDANGNFTVTFQSNHLTYFNLDWAVPICEMEASVTISGGDKRTLSLRATVIEGGESILITIMNPGPNVTVPVGGVPVGAFVDLEVLLDGMKVGGTTADLCAEGSVTIPVTLPPGNPATLSVQVDDVCPNDPTVRTGVPDTPVCYRKTTGGPEVCPVTDGNGALFIEGLTDEADYEVTVQDRRTGTLDSRVISVTGAATFGFFVPEPCLVALPKITGSIGIGG